MNSRVSWSTDGIDPSVRERAEAAARRAGMSLNDWLNSTVGDITPPDFRNPADRRQIPASREARDVADIHQRLDSITRQIEQISRSAPRSDIRSGGDSSVARQLNDAISRLDARLSQISNPQGSRQNRDRQAQSDTDDRGTQPYRQLAPLSSSSLDFAVAEITARQHELDAAAPMQVPERPATPIAAPVAPAGPDFSSLERHLIKITSQIEALQRPDDIERSIAAFRSELTEIRVAITEAVPRRAIESIESEVRALSRRIDETRQNAVDGHALAGIERALSEIREVLRSLTPAEQLAGYDEAIRNLGAKLDLILRANDDPGTRQQLEGAIAALRAIVSNVASNDALARLSEDIQLLSAKVDQLTRAGDNNDNFAVLEQRIAALTSTLESRERAAASESTERLESALRSLSDRLDRMEVGNDSAASFAHLEQRVTYLLERLEASADHRTGNLSRVEDGLQDVLRHIERQQATFAALAESSSRRAPEPADSGLIDLVKRELSDIRFSQSETNRHTQDSLETVHNTLGHVVDRLAMIEGDLRVARAAAPEAAPPLQPSAALAASAVEPQPATSSISAAPQAKPELPNPAALQAAFAAAPRDFAAATVAAPVLPKAISEMLDPNATAAGRITVAPELPPDHPLEPGTRPGPRGASPSERIAASESAISEIPAPPRPPVSSSSFIAAARRAAQAAAAQPANDKAARSARGIAKAKDANAETSTLTSRIRSLLVGASVVVIVLGTFKLAMDLLEGSSPPQSATIESAGRQQQPPQPPAEATSPAAPDQISPSTTSPTPIGRQSISSPPPIVNEGAASVAIPPAEPTPSASPTNSSDVTGSITAPSAKQDARKLGWAQVPPSESLPDAIGGPTLRAAALKGDPSAAYEVAVRFAEGKGVAPNLEEAAKWYDRAAEANVVPAIFRLGTLYEKGLGVKKDADTARRYYLQAAERGNAKAMHNLAVLDADGGGKGANYKSAADWFRRAAERGVADSQFNLGILYARGIGVEQNLPESLKWFSLAAGQGDSDAARKRDEVAKRLDAQSLAAAKLAVQTFSAEPQPDDAVNVPTPPGGWDAVPGQANMAKLAAKPAFTKRASR